MADPITPPPKLVRQWDDEWFDGREATPDGELDYIATQAARWGADQELEACCQALRVRGTRMRCMEANQTIEHLRAARRPKPPSLKEQAQVELDRLVALISTEGALAMAEPIRRALEALDD